ncbi:MAG TPA: hypothetical protein VFT72_03755 [Opitutaceae bacterium]|nr:hypothetical protein [Opitutaceae bacterium]
MLRSLKNLFHRPAIRMGRVDNSTIETTRLRNAQFVSFFSQSGGFAPMSTDRYDARLRRRKQIKMFLTLAFISGGAWVVIESARALTIF